MHILRLAVLNFRNLQVQDFQPEDGLNLVTGGNAQGKTSLLEAIHFCAYMKSFRTPNTRDLIRDRAETASISASFSVHDMETSLRVTIRKGSRSVLIDGNKTGGLKDVVGRLKAVSMTPEQIRIFDGSPALRRSFVDSTAVMVYPEYAATLIEYQKAVKNRNVLLKQGGDDTLFSALEQAAAVHATRIGMMRRWAAKVLTEAMGNLSEELMGVKDAASIHYIPSGIREPDEARYIELFARSRERDRLAGYSTKGPHVDDFRVELYGQPARNRTSRGQRKALLIALKMAQAATILNFTKVMPVLLLDDMFGDLDRHMGARVLKVLYEWPGQCMITSVKPPEGLTQSRVFTMVQGQIRR